MPVGRKVQQRRLFFLSSGKIQTREENLSRECLHSQNLVQSKIQQPRKLKTRSTVRKSMKCTVKKHIRRGGKKSTKNCKSKTILGTYAASPTLIEVIFSYKYAFFFSAFIIFFKMNAKNRIFQK